MGKDPVFIVGVPRSGTTLLAALLSAHSKMSCGPETHFFRNLPNSNLDHLVGSDSWITNAVEFISSISHTSYSDSGKTLLIDKYHISKSQIADYLRNKEPSIQNILSSITEQHMVSNGKIRWIEKTPDHIEYVHTIRKYFPTSPIIRIIRDPRDTALSLMKMPWGTMTIHEALLYWIRIDDSSKDFFRTDKASYTIRYEDLIQVPTDQLKEVCDFIGEEFEESMLDTTQSGKQLNSRNVPWKEMASKPIDSSKVALWKREMSVSDILLAEAVLGDRLKEYEYSTSDTLERLGVIYPPSRVIDNHRKEFHFIASQGVRFWKTHPGEQPSAKIYIGDPANSDWFDGKYSKKILRTLSVIVEIVTSLFKNNKLFWISENSERSWTGLRAYLLKKLLEPYKI